jgi:hypothetical protein
MLLIKLVMFPGADNFLFYGFTALQRSIQRIVLFELGRVWFQGTRPSQANIPYKNCSDRKQMADLKLNLLNLFH